MIVWTNQGELKYKGCSGAKKVPSNAELCAAEDKFSVGLGPMFNIWEEIEFNCVTEKSETKCFCTGNEYSAYNCNMNNNPLPATCGAQAEPELTTENGADGQAEPEPDNGTKGKVFFQFLIPSSQYFISLQFLTQ